MGGPSSNPAQDIGHWVVVTEDRLEIVGLKVEDWRRSRSSPNVEYLHPTSIRSEVVLVPPVQIAEGL